MVDSRLNGSCRLTTPSSPTILLWLVGRLTSTLITSTVMNEPVPVSGLMNAVMMVGTPIPVSTSMTTIRQALNGTELKKFPVMPCSSVRCVSWWVL